MKLKDLLNKKVNSRNQQISFDLRKTKLKSCNLDVDDILDIELKREKKKWQMK